MREWRAPRRADGARGDELQGGGRGAVRGGRGERDGVIGGGLIRPRRGRRDTARAFLSALAEIQQAGLLLAEENGRRRVVPMSVTDEPATVARIDLIVLFAKARATHRTASVIWQ